MLKLPSGISLDGDTVVLLNNPRIPWGDYGQQGENSFLNDYLRLFVQYQGRRPAGFISIPRSRLLHNLLMLAEDKTETKQLCGW